MEQTFEARFLSARRAVIAARFQNLNEMQREGVLTTQGPLLLLAVYLLQVALVIVMAYGGNDLYFNVSLNGNTYTFTVESYLCDNTTDVYAAVKNLQVGDKIDMEGFLYWYNGVNPHITSVTAAQ